MVVGPGDDAAILRMLDGANLVATTDMLMDGVDFELHRHESERIGRKALAVNLSDLAAMAASPVAALVSVALPRQGGEALAKRLYEGMLPLAAEFDCPIAGGDTNSWDGPLVISVTALGEVKPQRRWLRSGARPGDSILVTGEFGGSIRGRQFDFIPRVKEALWLAEHAPIHAAIDVSDGLSLDLSRICEASHCGAVLDLASVPIAPAAHELVTKRNDSQTAIDNALGDGEDFELILAAPPEVAADLVARQPLCVPLTRIGEFIEQPGLFCSGKAGKREPLVPRGYEHRL
ncbi:MAG: thiamine-monophosphate kinase [Planctomycetia bacterium]|nr:thiamine-monophosphate kinase [Planctomycetia bacterium]